MAQQFIVGTSEWLYAEWARKYYPFDIARKDWFKYYARHFRSVEINSTFYHMPRSETMQKWHDESPDGFTYVIKLNRYLTHLKRLKTDEEIDGRIEEFYGSLQQLGSKLAAVIAQLPPNLAADPARLEHLLQKSGELTKRYKLSSHLAVEFRHGSWFTDETYTMLRKYNAANVINSSPNRWPANKQITADFCYLRFHGSKKLYGSSYSDAELNDWAQFVRDSAGDCHTIYAFFNNDQHAYAPHDAARFARLLNG